MPTEQENTTLPSQTDERGMAIFELEPKVQRFLQLYMTGNYTIVKIAQLLEVHPNTCYNWMRREDVKNALAESQGEIHGQVTAQLKNLTLKAANKLTELIDSPIDAIALQAVKDVLDRGGHKTKNEIKVEKTVTTVEQKMKELIDSTIDTTILEGEFEEVAE